jgi:hypothetical protein
MMVAELVTHFKVRDGMRFIVQSGCVVVFIFFLVMLDCSMTILLSLPGYSPAYSELADFTNVYIIFRCISGMRLCVQI